MIHTRLFTLVARLLIIGAFVFGIVMLAAPAQAQTNNPTIGQIQANPSAYYDQIMTLNGNVERYIDENEFMLNNGTGSIEVDTGPPWYQTISVPVGTNVTITGQIDIMSNGAADLDACRIVTPSETIEIRDCSFEGSPPWAGGPNRNAQSDSARESDDDFYGIIESRPSGTAGVWVIGGRSFTATSSTVLYTDDGPLTVGKCTSADYEGNIAKEIESEPARACTR
jgi:uncharacterized protein YdeI (BOF family)